jgi:hypothetical protein
MIVECPHCYTRVLPMENNICPACKMDMSDMEDVNPELVSVVIRESDELPPYCYLCNSYTERYVTIVGDKGTLLDEIASRLVPVRQNEDRTSNVYVRLPQCENCAELENPSPRYVDYEHQTMTFIVNKGFKERVQPTPVEKANPNIDDSVDETSGGL